MKKLFKVLAVCAAVVAVASSTASAQLLWKITGKDAKGTSYMFGTHHIAPLSMMDSVKGLHQAILTTDKTYGEVDMAVMAKPEFQQKVMASVVAPFDSTLNKVFTPKQLDSINTRLVDLTQGMAEISSMNNVKPSIVSVQIVAMQSMKLFPDFNPQQPIDAEVQKFALTNGKPVRGLETADEQIDLLYNKPISVQAKELMETIRDFDQEAEKTVKLGNAYKTQDFNAIAELLKPEDEKHAAELDELIYNRNDKWMKTILQQLPQESMLICVGAGHLVGDKGLVQQLRNAGYTVEPVK